MENTTPAAAPLCRSCHSPAPDHYRQRVRVGRRDRLEIVLCKTCHERSVGRAAQAIAWGLAKARRDGLVNYRRAF